MCLCRCCVSFTYLSNYIFPDKFHTDKDISNDNNRKFSAVNIHHVIQNLKQAQACSVANLDFQLDMQLQVEGPPQWIWFDQSSMKHCSPHTLVIFWLILSSPFLTQLHLRGQCITLVLKFSWKEPDAAFQVQEGKPVVPPRGASTGFQVPPLL